MTTSLAVAVATLMMTASSTPGAQPHDVGTAHHEAEAREHEQLADVEAARYNPDASVAVRHCSLRSACWTSTANPTAQHHEEAKKHEKMAADHRAASQALRDAEARACGDLPAEDRDMSPFDHRQDIASVDTLTEHISSEKGQYARTTGAVVTFRAVPGMTPQWLQRLVDCHLARNAALGHDVPEMPNCPLVPKNVTARVSATDAGFTVAVRSDDSDVAAEILRRAKALLAVR